MKESNKNNPHLKNRLVIFSGVEHHFSESGFLAHGGFVREIDIWARIFEQVLVVTRSSTNPILADEVPYTERNITVAILPAPVNTEGVWGKIKLILFSPIWFWKSYKMLSAKDVIMARGPESIGFLGWLVSRFSRLPRFAKYVNQWEGYETEPLGYRVQRRLYRSRTFGGPVMIYGPADDRYPHLVPFFPMGISQKEWDQAGTLAKQRVSPPPFHLLFVGRFFHLKGIDILMDAVKILKGQRDDLVVDLVGDGPERRGIEELIARYGITNIYLHGWLGPDEISRFYAQAHVFIHPSRREGFGKVLVEAMSYGLPIVGADVGVSRELVKKNRCGVLFHKEDVNQLVAQINYILSSSTFRQEFGDNGRRTSQSMVLERLEQRYRQFVDEWSLSYD
jgi:glycosyltransferase involved in cell wall biosynthesis